MGHPELARGLGAGCVVAATLLVLAIVARARGRSDPLPGSGVVLVLAVAWGIAPVRDVPPGVIAGTLGLVAVGTLPWLRRSTAALLVSSAPFAWLIAQDSSSTLWIRVATGLGAWLGAVAATRTEERWHREALTPALFAITAAGVFLAVPDTEEAAVLLGVAAPLAALGWPARLVTLGRGGAAGAAAVAVWVIAIGGRGRPPSIVGGLACLGLLVALSGSRWLRPPDPMATRRRAPRRAQVPLLLAAHTVIVVVASRVAGISHELRVAVPVAAASGVTAVIAGAALDRGDRVRPPR